MAGKAEHVIMFLWMELVMLSFQTIQTAGFHHCYKYTKPTGIGC
jgi:hypothetical protein